MDLHVKPFLPVLALLLAFAPPLPAGPDPCLSQPTQACLFDMALRQADGHSRFAATVHGYLTVAYLQEQEGTGTDKATRAALLERLTGPDADLLASINALQQARFSVMLSGIPAELLPETDRWVADTLADLEHRAGVPAGEGRTPPLPRAEAEAIAAKIAAAPPDPLAKFARLEGLRGPEVPRLDRLARRFFSSGLSREQQLLLQGLFDKGALSGARREIDTWPDAGDRAIGHARLALALARAGEIEQALELVQSPALRDAASLEVEAQLNLVEVWARAGNGAKATEVLAAMGLPPDFTSEPQVTPAMVAADLGAVRDLLARYEGADRYLALEQAIDAVIADGPALTEALVAILPDDQKPEALFALGRARIGIGDAVGALETIGRLGSSTLTEDHLRRRLHADLAPLLAATGDPAGAAELAADLGLADVTALVAARSE